MSWIWFQQTKSGAPWREDLVLHQGAPITTVFCKSAYWCHLYPFESIKIHLISDYASSSLIHFCLSATLISPPHVTGLPTAGSYKYIQILLNPSIHPFEPPKNVVFRYLTSSLTSYFLLAPCLPTTLWLAFSKHPHLSAVTIVYFPVCLIIPSNLDTTYSHDQKSSPSWADALERSHMKRIFRCASIS